MIHYISTGNYANINNPEVLDIEKDLFGPMFRLKKAGYQNVQGTDFMDALIAAKCGFDKRNVISNDFDAYSTKRGRYLENKRVSGIAKGIYAEFPDLNRDGVKLEELKRGVLITIAVCPASHILEYFLVLNSADIYDAIEKRFKKAIHKNRSTVKIPLKDILFKGHASIVANSTFFTKEDVCEDLKMKSKKYLDKVNPNFIYTLEDINWVIDQHMKYEEIGDTEMEEMAKINMLFKTDSFLTCTSKTYQELTGNEPTEKYLKEMMAGM